MIAVIHLKIVSEGGISSQHACCISATIDASNLRRQYCLRWWRREWTIPYLGKLVCFSQKPIENKEDKSLHKMHFKPQGSSAVDELLKLTDTPATIWRWHPLSLSFTFTRPTSTAKIDAVEGGPSSEMCPIWSGPISEWDIWYLFLEETSHQGKYTLWRYQALHAQNPLSLRMRDSVISFQLNFLKRWRSLATFRGRQCESNVILSWTFT